MTAATGVIGQREDAAPLIVTLVLDPGAQTRFDTLRREHFPPERNHLAAHVTVFHALPGERLPEVLDGLREAAPAQPVPVLVTGIRFLGRGVAFDLDSPGAAALRAALADRWAAWLTPQDRQRWRPHVTVQNKVDPAVARALRDRLTAGFTPYPVVATGLALWRYRGGPWEHVADVPFTTG